MASVTELNKRSCFNHSPVLPTPSAAPVLIARRRCLRRGRAADFAVQRSTSLDPICDELARRLNLEAAKAVPQNKLAAKRFEPLFEKIQ